MNSVPASTSAALGFGGATFGREIDEAASASLLDEAWAKGIRHFDTAAAYSNGLSERILGRWLATRRPLGATVATKALPPYTAEALSASLASSLERLGVARVDVYYLHRWDASLGDDGLRVLDDAVRAGKVGSIGLSNVTPAAFEQVLGRQVALGLTPFKVLQCNHNYAVSEFDPSMQAVRAKYGFEVVTFSPLGAGFLTGKHREGVVPGSRFDIVPGHQSIYFQPEAKRRLERLHRVAAQTGVAAELLALRWALSTPGVETVLVGGRTMAHLNQALQARNHSDAQTKAALRELGEDS